jgi:hypothetical protein
VIYNISESKTYATKSTTKLFGMCSSIYTFLLYLKSRFGRKCRGKLKEDGALTNRNNLLGPMETKKHGNIRVSSQQIS